MIRLEIISVGKKHQAGINELIDDYQTRLKDEVAINWRLIAHSNHSNVSVARSDESSQISKLLQPDRFIILLDETGKQMSSPDFCELLFSGGNRQIQIVIGGAYGVDDAIKQKANYVLSLSKMVFPHMLVRLILVEQIYRAAKINQNHPYHHY